MNQDELIRDASEQLRRLSAAENEVDFARAIRQLTERTIPALESESLAMARATRATFRWLLRQRTARRWKPTI